MTPTSPSAVAPTSTAVPAVGEMLRRWRAQRHLSQMALALDVGISPRHLSCVETGRSRASPATLLALAEQLRLPLRERNHLLLAAGYAPRYSEQGLQASAMDGVRSALQRLMDAHDPYPGLVLDRQWNVVLANRAATALAALVPPALKTPQLNIFRASLHPQALAAHTLNFEEWADTLLANLQRSVLITGDAGLRQLEAEVLQYPNVQALRRGRAATGSERPALLVPCVLALPTGTVSLFTTLTTFGTARDVTLEELCVELFYPSDAPSEALLRAGAPAARAAASRSR
jgi:transcriptional regulator with XRE-family HTH domain